MWGWGCRSKRLGYIPPEEYKPVQKPADLFRSSGWPLFEGPLEKIPASRTELYQVYGNPGTADVDKAWARKNLVVAKHLLGTWNGHREGEGRLYTHRLAEPYLREALRRCMEAGVLGYIKRLGCFNFRHQRHDTSRPLSDHSWGIAFDINPADNFGVYRHPFKLSTRRRPVPAPFGPGWPEIWPEGVPKELVEAFKSVGFEWGGDWKTYCDTMHMSLRSR